MRASVSSNWRVPFCLEAEVKQKTRVTVTPHRIGYLTVEPCGTFKRTWKGQTWDDDQALTQGAMLQLSQEQEPVLQAMGRTARHWFERGWAVTTYLPVEEAEALFHCAY
jgi:hypothetical protein